MPDRKVGTVDGTRHAPRDKGAGSLDMQAHRGDVRGPQEVCSTSWSGADGRGIAVRDACKPP